MLEADLHQLRQRIQPRDAVVDLKDGLASRLQDAVALVHELLRIRRVLDDAVRVDEIERVVGKRQALGVGDLESPGEPLLRKLALASAMADSVRSTPETSAPPFANRARSTPAPQPTSSTDRPRQPLKSTSRSRW